MTNRKSLTGRNERRLLSGVIVATLGFVPAAIYAQAAASARSATICFAPKPRTDGCSGFVFYDGVAVLGVARGTHDFELIRTRRPRFSQSALSPMDVARRVGGRGRWAALG